MKKILLTFFVFICIYDYSYADSCEIKNAPSSALSEYIQNTNLIISNINSELLKQPALQKSKIKKNLREMKSIFNNNLDWSDYSSYFDYYVSFALSNEVPIEIKRDYTKLEKQQERINKYISFSWKKSSLWIEISSICDNIDNCDLQDTRLTNILSILSKNHSNIMDFFRKTVMQDIQSTQEYNIELLFVSPNFKAEILKNYWAQSIAACSNQWGFWERASKIINKIELLNSQWEKGIELWKQQIDRLYNISQWNYSSADQIRENELLRQELSRQWISGEKRESMSQALHDFNSRGWFHANNNPISNSFRYLQKNITQQITDFKESIVKSFRDQWEESDFKVTVHQLQNITKEEDIDKYIQYMTERNYNFELPSSINNAEEVNEVRRKIIDLHNALKDSNDILKSTAKYSSKACNQQNPWIWNCWQNN